MVPLGQPGVCIVTERVRGKEQGKRHASLHLLVVVMIVVVVSDLIGPRYYIGIGRRLGTTAAPLPEKKGQ